MNCRRTFCSLWLWQFFPLLKFGFLFWLFWTTWTRHQCTTMAFYPAAFFPSFLSFFLHILKARFFCQASHKMQRDDDKWDCLSTPSRFDESWIHTFYSCGTLFNLVAKPLTTSTNLYQAVGTEGVKGGYLPPPIFWQITQTYSSRGAGYAHHINTYPPSYPGFYTFSPALCT